MGTIGYRFFLYFVRSGLLNIINTTGTFRSVGEGGHEWSSRGSTKDANGANVSSAYNFHFYATGIGSSFGPWIRWYAFPLRCLSTVLGM